MKKRYYYFVFLLVSLLTIKKNVLHAQGALWGMTQNGGTHGLGVIFKTNADGTGYTVASNFTTTYPGGDTRYTRLAKTPNGKLYGVTAAGGVYDKGVIFEYDPTTSVYTRKFDFSDNTGALPTGSLTYASNGKLYGMTNASGPLGYGTLFEYDPATNVFTKKIDFTYANGYRANGSLIQASNGNLYGVTSQGGSSGGGVLFEYNPVTNVLTKKVDFTGTTTGKTPNGDLTEAPSGKLYGLTVEGGANGAGTLFEFDITAFTTNPITGEKTYGVFTKKIDLVAAIGSAPYGSLTNANQKLYGLTSAGGANGGGVLFEYDPSSNTYTVKNHLPYGAKPSGSLLLASNGKLYGMTNSDGTFGYGTIFEYNPASGTFLTSYTFTLDRTQGAYPMGSLTEGANGKLYGLTPYQSGLANYGTLFEFTPATSTYVKKLDFNLAINGTNKEGFYQNISLTQSSANGKFYGTTRFGGVKNAGVIFEFNPATLVYTKKFDFTGTNGANPVGTLVQAPNGKLYGVANSGGTLNGSVLFEYDPVANTFTKRINFDSNTSPFGGYFMTFGLAATTNGKLYGITISGGANSNGVLFEYDPATASCIKKLDFPNKTLAGTGVSQMIQATNGKLYGITMANLNHGTFFEIDLATNTYTKKVDFTGTNGSASGAETLIEYTPGKIIGTTGFGGTNNQGVMFEYDCTTSTFTKKLDFPNYPQPNNPIGLVQSNGKFYGPSRASIFEYDQATQVLSKKTDLTLATGDLATGSFTVEKPNVSVATPANGAINQNVTLTVTAKALTGATTYTIELNESPLFAGTSIVKTGARSQSFSGLAYNKQYFTRVKTDPSPVWGAVTTFTTGTAESFAYVATPANAATNQNANLTVTANAVIGATTYTLELNTASDFTGTSLVKSGSRSQVYNNLALSTTYYTRVKTDLSPAWGPTRSFTTGSATGLSYITAPANNATNQLWTLNITANTITGASSYTIQLSPVSDFSSGIIERTGSTPALAFTGLAYNTLYYARVTTDLSPGSWGAVRSFTTGHPTNFSYITSPANAATNVNWVVTLTSNPVQDATQYTIEANTASDFTGTAIVNTAATRTIGFTLAYNQLYYVRVKTNLSPDWGATRSFTTGSPVSFAYVTSPVNGAANVATTVNVQSNTVTGATSYTIELNTAADFSGTSIVKTSASRTINFAALTPATTYYTRVSTNLSAGAWGATRSFTTITSGRIAQPSGTEQTSTAGVEEQFAVTVLSNPFHETLSFVIHDSDQTDASVQILDLTGRVFHESVQKTKATIELTTPLTQGMYILRVRTPANTGFVRVLKLD